MALYHCFVLFLIRVHRLLQCPYRRVRNCFDNDVAEDWIYLVVISCLRIMDKYIQCTVRNLCLKLLLNNLWMFI